MIYEGLGDFSDWEEDLYAFYGNLVRANPDSLFAHISRRIVRDEARHLAFSELYLASSVRTDPSLKPTFIRMRDELLFLIENMVVTLKAEADLIGVDGPELFAAVADEVEKKGERLSLGESAEDLEAPV